MQLRIDKLYEQMSVLWRRFFADIVDEKVMLVNINLNTRRSSIEFE
jgi:hypothetical protein